MVNWCNIGADANERDNQDGENEQLVEADLSRL